jgi:YfiH family protein
VLADRRRAVVDLPWTWLRQVHGARVITVTEPGAGAGEEADAAVTAIPGAALAVHTADCAPVVLLADGSVGIAHAGWKGLLAGVVEMTAGAMRDLGAEHIRAVIGPHIGAECYEFGAADLDALAASLGESVRSTTSWGSAALDLGAGVRVALARAGIDDVAEDRRCTACADSGTTWFSHRARGEVGRMATVVWLA